MKQYPLIQVGNLNLRKTCSSYTKKEISSPITQKWIARMKYTMRKVKGVGLAAPQVGLQKQAFVYRLTPTKYRPNLHRVRPCAVFNPLIVSAGKKTVRDWEGCLSVADANLFAKVSRPEKICVSYLNEKAETVECELSGLEARVFLHEYDHLIGKVYLDHSPDPATFMSASEYKLMRKQQLNIG